MKRLILVSLLSLIFLGCHSRIKTQPAPNKPQPPRNSISKSSCDLLKEDQNPRPIVTYSSRDIERHFQRTIRSCEGRVISDEIETVQSPHGKLNIYPSAVVKNPKDQVHWSIVNRQTCRGGGFRHLDDGAGIRVWLDVANAWLTFEVVPGRNIIDYTYSVCDRQDPKTQTCDKKQHEEKGSVVLDVKYQEITIPGIREIKYFCPTAR